MSVVGVKHESRDQSKSKHTVFGYIRRHENDGSIYVPEVIKKMCVEFYWLEEWEEKFVRVTRDWPVLHLDEGDRLVHNIDGINIHSLYPNHNRNYWVKGSVGVDAESREISKCQWTVQIANGDLLGRLELSLLIIGISDGQYARDDATHYVQIYNGKLRSSETQRAVNNDVVSGWEPHELRVFDEVTMELDVENHKLNFNFHATPYSLELWPDSPPERKPELWSCEIRNLPEAKYHLFAIVGHGHSLRLKDFSIQHRSCPEIPVIPRDVPFSCTHWKGWIIRILLVVLWMIMDCELNRQYHQIGYLWPKIIYSAACSFMFGIRYGINL